MDSVANLINESGAVRRGDFLLSDGSLTDYYIDKYVFETTPEILDKITAALVAQLSERDFDLLAGPALGAVPLVTAVSLESQVPAVFIRSDIDHQGTQARIEGKINKGQRAILIDDVSMTGETVLETARIVENAGGIVDCIIVVVDRDEEAANRIAEAGYDFQYLTRVGGDLQVK